MNDLSVISFPLFHLFLQIQQHYHVLASRILKHVSKVVGRVNLGTERGGRPSKVAHLPKQRYFIAASSFDIACFHFS